MGKKTTIGAIIALVALCTFAIVLSVTVEQYEEYHSSGEITFVTFKDKHNKMYHNEDEHNYRKAIFEKNVETVRKHNENPEKTSRMEINHLSDRTSEEIRTQFTGIDKAQLFERMNSLEEQNGYTMLDVADVPKQLDWRTKGAITSVKNQGQCGSCWAFSAAGSLQSAYYLKTGTTLDSFSEQQLVDCTYRNHYKNYGCGGGMVDNSFDYFEDTKAETDADYPYEGKNDSCNDDWSKGVTFVSNYHYVKMYDKDQLRAALTKGPVSVHVEADQPAFSHYAGGIITDASCGTNLDHAIVAVGYNADEDYLIVKNSWGSAWGESGYARISTASNICGVLSMMLYPEV